METDPRIMKCTNCNNIVPNDSIFCEHCGVKFPTARNNTATSQRDHAKVTSSSYKLDERVEDSWTQEPMTSVYVAGKLENELRHIHDDMELLKIKTGRTQIAVAIVVEIFFYMTVICFTAVLVDLVFSDSVLSSKTSEILLSVNYKDSLGLVIVIFLILSLISTFVRKQKLSLYRQSKITKKIISHVEKLISDLKHVK